MDIYTDYSLKSNLVQMPSLGNIFKTLKNENILKLVVAYCTQELYLNKTNEVFNHKRVGTI